MVLTARSKIEMGAGALNGDLGILLSGYMKSRIDHCVTGALVWAGERVFEVLEGDAAALLTLRATVSGDDRLADVECLEYVALTSRKYSNWVVATPPQCHPYVTGYSCADLTAGAVRRFVADIVGPGTLAASPPLVAAA